MGLAVQVYCMHSLPKDLVFLLLGQVAPFVLQVDRNTVVGEGKVGPDISPLPNSKQHDTFLQP